MTSPALSRACGGASKRHSSDNAMAQHGSWDSLVYGWCWMLQHVSTLTLWNVVTGCNRGEGDWKKKEDQNGAFCYQGSRSQAASLVARFEPVKLFWILDILDCGYVLHPLVQFFWIPSAGSMLASCSNTEGGNMVAFKSESIPVCESITEHEKMLWKKKPETNVSISGPVLWCWPHRLWVLYLVHVDYCYATSSHLPENERPPSAWKGAYWSAAALLGDAWSPAQRIGQHWQQNKTDIDWPTHFTSLHQESMKCAG